MQKYIVLFPLLLQHSTNQNSDIVFRTPKGNSKRVLWHPLFLAPMMFQKYLTKQEMIQTRVEVEE